MFDFLKSKSSSSDEAPAKDSNQEKYRLAFGIKDKYLLRYELDNKGLGFIVFIDDDIDVDWVDTRQDYFTTAEEQEKQLWVAKLDAVHMIPITNISDEDKLTFKKKLGIGYELAMVKSFNSIQPIIDECRQFVVSRNKEVSRSLFLATSAPVAVLAIIVLACNIELIKWYPEWVSGFCTGILGAFVSIWTRYGKTSMTGLSSKWLHRAEALCRLLVGSIFAIIAILAVKCGLLLNAADSSLIVYTSALVGFVAGFSERFVPSLIEKIVNDDSHD